jgi:hypothetical protein
MEPNRVGRILGISARVAARTIRERAAQAPGAATPNRAQPPASAVAAAGGTGRPAMSAEARSAPRAPGAIAAEAATKAAVNGKNLARGAGRFGATMLRPFAHAGGILALQITGVFFALFALFFLSHAWQTVRAAGWHDRHGQVYLGLGLVFAWFTVSSFWRARKRGR